MTSRKIANAALGPVSLRILFTGTIFLSASLLFFVQPLFAKIVLPHLGGAPAVWTTAMLFFQAALIAGYAYSHFMTRYLRVSHQILVHSGLWIMALIFLPLSIPAGWRYDTGGFAAWQTLVLFGGAIGLPFTILSANARRMRRIPISAMWPATWGR